jgi:hypothetical protein
MSLREGRRPTTLAPHVLCAAKHAGEQSSPLDGGRVVVFLQAVTFDLLVSYNNRDNLREGFLASCCKIDWQIFYRYKQQFRELIVPDERYKRDDHS